jgi:hypothetical protein
MEPIASLLPFSAKAYSTSTKGRATIIALVEALLSKSNDNTGPGCEISITTLRNMSNKPKRNGLALIALILAFAVPPIGNLVSIFSLIQIKKRMKKGVWPLLDFWSLLLLPLAFFHLELNGSAPSCSSSKV